MAKFREGEVPRMFADVITLQLLPDHISQAELLWHGEAVPALEEQIGYQGSFFAIERETGHALGVTFWRTREDLKDVLESGLYERLFNAFAQAETLVVPAIRHAHEVAASDLLSLGTGHSEITHPMESRPDMGM